MVPLHTEQGMGKGKTRRVKRRLLRAAVEDNLETIRGLPPRPLRPGRRLGRLWLRRLSLAAIPLTLAQYDPGKHQRTTFGRAQKLARIQPKSRYRQTIFSLEDRR